MKVVMMGRRLVRLVKSRHSDVVVMARHQLQDLTLLVVMTFMHVGLACMDAALHPMSTNLPRAPVTWDVTVGILRRDQAVKTLSMVVVLMVYERR